MKLKFIDYIKFCIAHDLEFDAIIGNVDMPTTFCFCEDIKITDYCMEKYGDLLNSECEVKYDTTGKYTDIVIVNYDDYRKGEQFTWAIAGYIGTNESKKLFDWDC